MPRSHKGHKFILCKIDEVPNYLITVPNIPSQVRRDRRSTYRKCDNKILHPRYFIMDQDSTFMSSLMTYLLNKFNIKIRTVASYNHQSLQAKHSTESLSTIIT